MISTDFHRLPTILPLGDQALLVRFATALSDEANRAAIAFADRLAHAAPEGVVEVDPNLVSVLVRYDPLRTTPDALAGELRLLVGGAAPPEAEASPPRSIPVVFGGEAGPDLAEAAAALGLAPEAFVEAHNAAPLRVLTTGFAPGFVYCGFHPEALHLPRRVQVRRLVPPGSVLFAAGQTAITATAIPTGWHVIGRTSFRNFTPDRDPPTQLREGERLQFLPEKS